MSIPKVFISYSWDNDLHKDWVVNLMNRLRNNGVDAEIDRSITQKGTVNLNRMMIQKFRESDFIIVVLTENYAKKADSYEGGVGLETTFLGNELLNNLKKVIPIKRENNKDDIVIPYCLKGVNYTDFSDDSRFNESLNELLHRLFGVDMIKVNPIGKRPDLNPKEVNYDMSTSNVFLKDFNIPDLKIITDIDKNKFMNDSFSDIKEYLIRLSDETQKRNSTFQYELKETNNYEYGINYYISGMQKAFVRIWIGAFLGGKEENIFISYNANSFSKSSFNEMIICEEENNVLSLKMTMSFKEKENSLQGIVKAIWDHICLLIK